MRKQDKGLEFYINGQSIKEERKYRFHKEIKMSFVGKAILINEDKKENDKNYQIELSSSYILNRSGNYKVIYIDSKEKSHIIYFSIRKKVPIFVFFLLFLPLFASILCFQGKTKNSNIEQEIPIQIMKEKEKDSYTFHMSFYHGNQQNSKNIYLSDTMTKKESINNKIAPGTTGEFFILLDTKGSTKDLIYEIQVEDKTEKPKNLYFRQKDGTEYCSLSELANKELKGRISKDSQKDIDIQWEWKYEISDWDNQIDVKDSNEIAKYQFKICAIGKEI